MRPAGKRLLGYYPTPPTTLTALAHLLSPLLEGHGHLLDPCAGTGDAAGFLATAWNLTSWGLEFHEQRAELAKSQLDHVLRTDSFHTRISPQAFSVLFLNPPYDHEAGIGRSEALWLKTWTPKLYPQGILLFLIQEKDIPALIPFLATYYRDVHVYRFPEPDYARFHQVAIIGTRKPHPHLSQTTQHHLLASLNSLPILPASPSIQWPITPTLTPTPPLFESTWLDPTRTYEECQRYGIWNDSRFHALLTPPPHDAHRPLLPLRRGHLVQLLAAGMLNNQVIATDTTRLVIKGHAFKHTHALPSTTTDTHHIHRVTETFLPQIQGWDLTPGPNFGRHLIIHCQPDTPSSSPTESTE